MKKTSVTSKKSDSNTIGVNADFFLRLVFLGGILVPSKTCPEVFYGLLVGLLLILRTVFDINIMMLNTSIERSIVNRLIVEFKSLLGSFFMMILPVSGVNCLLKYANAELKMRFRKPVWMDDASCAFRVKMSMHSFCNVMI